MTKSHDNVRVIYSGDPSRVDSVTSNPGKVFAVIGPFENFSDRRNLMAALEMVVRGHNYTPQRSYGDWEHDKNGID